MTNQPEVIDIGMPTPPKLSVAGNNDSGVIRLNNLPPLDTSTDTSMPKLDGRALARQKLRPSNAEPKSVNFGPGADLLMNPGRASRQNSPRSDIKLSELKSLDVNLENFGKKSLTAVERAKMFSSTATIPGGSPTIKLNIIEPSPTNPGVATSNSPGAGPNPAINPINLGPSTSTDSTKQSETWDGFKKFNEIPVNPAVNPPKSPPMSQEQILREKFMFIRKLQALEKKGVAVSKKYSMEDSLAEMKGEYEMIKSDMTKRNSVKFQGKMLMAFVSGIEFLNGKFDPFDIKLDGWGEAVSENIDEYDEIFGELHEKYGGRAKMAPELKLLFMLGGSAAMLHMTNTMFKSSVPGMDDIMRQNPELMHQFTQAAAHSMGQQNPGFGNFMAHVIPPRGSPPGPPSMMGSNRPDLNMARGSPSAFPGNVDKQNKSARREMKGPSDISDILSGIKTKKVNIRGGPSDNKSTISIAELNELQQDNINIPIKSKRKPRSEKNTVNLF